MSVRGVGRGGKAGGAGRAGPAAGARGAPKGGFGAKVDRAESLVGPSGVVGSSNVGATAATNAVVARAIELARLMRMGQIKSRDEATKKLVQDILRDKVRIQSKHLTEKIFEQLKGDPRLAKTLERLWNKAEE